MMALDPTITFGGATTMPSAAPAVRKPAIATPSKTPSVTNPARGSIGAAIASALSAIFKAFNRRQP
jgi:hypothetical protein